VGDEMIYTCAKCKFLFERKNEPSKCPSCENQYVVGASNEERQEYKQMLENRNKDENYSDTTQ